MTNSGGQTEVGIKPALLIIDVQKKYLSMIPQNDKELAFFFINHLIALFRKNNFPIIRIYHQNQKNAPDQEPADFEYPEEISISDNDVQVTKTYSDSFNKTDLAGILRTMGCNTLFLCGLSAVGCVVATRTGAQNNDFKAFIVKDAIMSHNSGYTRNAEAMFDAVSYDAVELIVQNCAK